MKPSNNLENKTPSDTYWRVQVVFKKVQVQCSLEPPLEYNQDQTDAFHKSRFIMTYKHLRSYRNMQFQIISRRENSKEIPELSILEFLEKFSANNFALSDEEDNTTGYLTDLDISNACWRNALAYRLCHCVDV